MTKRKLENHLLTTASKCHFKILFLTRHGQQGASSRLHCLQYLPWLQSAVIEYVVSPLLDDAMLLPRYRHVGYTLLKLLAAFWQRMNDAKLKAAAYWFIDSALPQRKKYRSSSRAVKPNRFSLDAGVIRYRAVYAKLDGIPDVNSCDPPC